MFLSGLCASVFTTADDLAYPSPHAPARAWPLRTQGDTLLAQLLVEVGGNEEAWSLLRGRVAERIGERDQAVRSYSWVVGMWRQPDPELEPYAAEAREGLARLTAEKR